MITTLETWTCDSCDDEVTVSQKIDKPEELDGWITLIERNTDYMKPHREDKEEHHFCGIKCLKKFISGREGK